MSTKFTYAIAIFMYAIAASATSMSRVYGKIMHTGKCVWQRNINICNCCREY